MLPSIKSRITDRELRVCEYGLCTYLQEKKVIASLKTIIGFSGQFNLQLIFPTPCPCNYSRTFPGGEANHGARGLYIYNLYVQYND
jgi:hypothetical protein